jgi:hypothetical protein
MGAVPVRRAFPSLLSCMAALSILGALGLVGAFLYAQASGPNAYLDYRILGARYTLRCSSRDIRLFRPPSVVTSSEDAAAIARLRDDEIVYRIRVRRSGQELLIFSAVPDPIVGPSRFSELTRPLSSAPVTALLEALEDENRFVAAHYWLAAGLTGTTAVVSKIEGSQLVLDIFGLRATLNPTQLNASLPNPTPRVSLAQRGGLSGEDIHSTAGAIVAIDRGQMPKIRRAWHDRLDQQALRVPYLPAIIGSLICPVLWYLQRRKLRQRQKFGRCLNCGYDLRASQARCPECGNDIHSSVGVAG